VRSHGQDGHATEAVKESIKEQNNSRQDAKGRQANKGVPLCASLRLGVFA
jgi:hypothetical protein